MKRIYPVTSLHKLSKRELIFLFQQYGELGLPLYNLMSVLYEWDGSHTFEESEAWYILNNTNCPRITKKMLLEIFKDSGYSGEYLEYEC